MLPFNLGWGEILMVLLLALMFLGPKKLPELAAGLGKMIREFRKATADIKGELQIEENLRKPFEELREAVTLPAEELKRRDLWKAEWEAREQAERERAEREAAEQAAKLGAPADAPPTDAPPGSPGTPVEPERAAEATAIRAMELPGSGLTPGGIEGEDRTQTIDKTIVAPAPIMPTAPPIGTVAARKPTPPPPPAAARLPAPRPAARPVPAPPAPDKKPV